ncbi:MAG: L-seryl-tRNA(Sec) selenium transferase [Planctomycetes bacterium]|nr:L-seryl-tRNA(Sec) selenium transferase [Planctomycetota bacterium]
MNHSSPVPLRNLPAVAAVLEHAAVQALLDEHGRPAVTAWIREEVARLRERLRSADGSDSSPDELLEVAAAAVAQRSRRAEHSRLGAVVNATGVILHTGLGRAPLSAAARAVLAEAAGAVNVEIDLETTDRRYRGHQMLDAWQTLTGCEDALVVNNNAAATLLTLQSLCAGREVVISRGQLIEIGGSFRLPEIFALSGATLKEVGTTNRTRLEDYDRAIGPETAAVMHVHPSNYRIVGFTTSPPIEELVELARRRGIVAIDDIGSGSLVDVTKYGLPAEPTFQQSIAAGADVVLGSGDKLLGGPQAGIVLGTGKHVDRIRRHPLARAVRVGKLTLAALQATLDAYLRQTAEKEVPTVAMMAATLDSLLERARTIEQDCGRLERLKMDVRRDTAPVGGGSLPAAELPTAVLALAHAELSPDELGRRLRLGRIRLVCRIQNDAVLVDLRSVLPEDDSKICLALGLVDGGGL